MRLITNPQACVGSGQCVLTEPELFDQDDDGTVVLLTENPEAEQLDGARSAVALCPGRALSLVEAGPDEPTGDR